MKKTLHSIIFALTAALSLLSAACTYEGDTIVSSQSTEGSSEESLDFISESLSVIMPEEKETSSMNVRFYQNDRYLPYVGLQYYLEEYMKYTIVSSSYSNDEYRYTVKDTLNGNKRAVIIVNKKTDSIRFPSYADIKNFGSEISIRDKLNLFVVKYAGEKSRTFDLAKYGFKVYGATDEVYIPLCILSNLFSSLQCKRYFYNGKSVYTTENDGPYYDKEKGYDSFYKSDWYTDADGNFKERPQALIDYSYNLLCFTHDTLYGHPGYYGIASLDDGCPDEEKTAALDKLEFDQLLHLNEETESIRKLLLSSSYKDYMYGLMRLCYKVYGDCHTAFTANQDIYTLRQAIEDHSYNNVCSKKFLAMLSSRQIIPKWRKDARKDKASGASYIPRDSNGLPAFEVIDGNKTAIIRFDSFVVDGDGWTAYYGTNPTTSPDPASVSLPNDSIGTFYKSFYAIENEPQYAGNVKNVVIDISTNGGGESDVLQFLLNYMIADPQDSSLLTLDVISGGKKILTARSDLNLDGKIDSNDKKKNYNFLIFTSLMSFSCGNAMPAICADNGIEIIGQKSGGGSCVVRHACTADGFPYQYSGLERISRKDWSNVEGGIPVSEGGEIPYDEHMFDDDVLAGVVNALFP